MRKEFDIYTLMFNVYLCKPFKSFFSVRKLLTTSFVEPCLVLFWPHGLFLVVWKFQKVFNH